MIGIIYFSGTGNTAYVANYIKEKLKGQEVDLIPLNILNSVDLTSYDILYVGYPVYACAMPEIVAKSIKTLNLNKDTKIHLFATMAFFAGSVMKNTERLFVDKNMKVESWIEVKMPGSDGLGFMSLTSKTVKRLKEKSFDHLPEVDRWLVNGDKRKKLINNPVFSTIVNMIFKKVEKKMKSNFYATQDCILCKKCEIICPTKNIEVTNQVIFKDHCMLCMRCLHQCPVEAIQIGQKTIGKFRYKGPDGKAKFD